MKHGALLAAIAIVAAAGGGAALWFISWSKQHEEAKRLAMFAAEVVKETTRTPVDVEACRVLLQKLSRDPRRDEDPRLVRGRAELMLLLGKPTQQAWEVLEAQATGVDATPEDWLLGARILERRHAETGEKSQAYHGAVLAEQHFRATGDVATLQKAWLLAFRAGDDNAQKRYADLLTGKFQDSVAARLVSALASFYRSYLGTPREVDKATLDTLAALDAQVEVAPAELTIALAVRDIDGSLEQVQAALEGLEVLTKSYRSSILARELLALGYVKLRTVQGCEQSLFHLDWLLKNHPDKPAAEFWRNLRPAVAGELERLRKGPKPVK